jgi:hypothetical protein
MPNMMGSEVFVLVDAIVEESGKLKNNMRYFGCHATLPHDERSDSIGVLKFLLWCNFAIKGTAVIGEMHGAAMHSESIR